MQQEFASTDRIAEFTCPRCGASAFEVTGIKHQVNLDVDAATDRTLFISMECLCCLRAFHHELREQVLPQVLTRTEEEPAVGFRDAYA